MILHFEPGSFRDKTSRVFYLAGDICRALDEHAHSEWEALRSTAFFKKFSAAGKIITTEQITPDDATIIRENNPRWTTFLKHQQIPFISYPYEWSFGMLKDVALLQGELLLAALDEGMILKDSSAFNFQWIGSRPVFIDIPSFVTLGKGEPWVGYRQYCQMYLYPLMLQAYKNINYQGYFRMAIDGMEPQDFNKLMSLRDLLRRGVFLHVYLQAKAQLRFADARKDVRSGLRIVGFTKEMIKNNIQGLLGVIEKLEWRPPKSQWSHYMNEHNYTSDDHSIKKAFVRDIIRSHPWNLVWDIGCNTGAFSRIASENSQHVIALDADHLAVDHFYNELKGERNTKILPLVCNIADPSPNLGWRGLERKQLNERGNPDLVLCLALLHHIVISANIPLSEFIAWIAGMKTDLIIEFVSKEDPMVKKLLLNKPDNYEDYEMPYFEHCLACHFTVVRKKALASGTRTLFFAERKK